MLESYIDYDIDGSLISFNYNGTDYFYVYNALGDIVKLLNASGQVVVEYRYDAFGNILYQTTGALASANPYRYRGYRYDEETKLYYLNSRYYNPQTGRFLNADGLLQGSQTTLGFNLFAYVENNPVVNIDPSGYCTTQDANDDGIFQDNENPLCGGKAQGQGTPQGDVKMFRGGNDFTPKPDEVKIDKATNYVDPARGGVSVNTDPNHHTVTSHGGAYQIDYLPPGLGYRASPNPSNPGHHSIIPTNQMTFDQYMSLLHQIISSIFGG